MSFIWPMDMEDLAVDGLFKLQDHLSAKMGLDVSLHNIVCWKWLISDAEILAVRGIGRRNVRSTTQRRVSA